jgi:hypothetical protein
LHSRLKLSGFPIFWRASWCDRMVEDNPCKHWLQTWCIRKQLQLWFLMNKSKTLLQ